MRTLGQVMPTRPAVDDFRLVVGIDSVADLLVNEPHQQKYNNLILPVPMQALAAGSETNLDQRPAELV
jgi:hypothetical protein